MCAVFSFPPQFCVPGNVVTLILVYKNFDGGGGGGNGGDVINSNVTSNSVCKEVNGTCGPEAMERCLEMAREETAAITKVHAVEGNEPPEGKV